MFGKRVKEIRKKSIKQEKKVSKEIGGKTTVASGALYTQKGDSRSDKLLVECKTTEKDYYPLTLSTWNKIEKEAYRDGLRIPVMQIQLVDGLQEVAILRQDDFDDFTKKQFVTIVDYYLRGQKSVRIRYHQDFEEVRPNPFVSLTILGVQAISSARLVFMKWSDFLEVWKEYAK